MRCFRGTLLLGALTVLAAADTARAAWDNVFQLSCFRCRPRTSNYVAATPIVAAAPAPAACPQPCPQQVCTTQYVQRSYYQPVTTYEQRNYVEAVTTYRTSYYCEPVTSYRYSCYYDPCTCSYQQVATPVTSYRMRSRCDPVTSYLQRCQMVPVQSYRLSCYYEPVTTCCTTTVGAPIAALPPGATVAPAPAPGVGEQIQPLTPNPRPGLGEQIQPLNPNPRPGVGENTQPLQGGNGGYQRLYPTETKPPPMAGALDSSRQPRLNAPAPVSSPAAPKVRLDKITSLPGSNLEGQVVQADQRTPQPGARLLFVCTSRDNTQQAATADGQGRFETSLSAGSWVVYVRDSQGTPVFQKSIRVDENESQQLRLVSR